MTTSIHVPHIPIFRVRLILLILAAGFVATQAVIAAGREGGLLITAGILGAVGLGGFIGAVAMRAAAGRAEKRVRGLAQDKPAIAFLVVHHPGLRDWANKQNKNYSIGTYPLALVEKRGISLVGASGGRAPSLEWSDAESVELTALTERFFIRRAVKIRTQSGSVVLAPYGGRSLVGFHAPSESEFDEFYRAVGANLR